MQHMRAVIGMKLQCLQDGEASFVFLVFLMYQSDRKFEPVHFTKIEAWAVSC